jgi:DNA-binding transcriptional LysR family regulator
MLDLNDLRIFDKVAALGSFSAAARALGLAKSSVSRSITRLETLLDARLFQRSARTTMLTEAGVILQRRCVDLLAQVDETVDYFGGLGDTPRGALKVSAGFGFGLNVLSELLPLFIEKYAAVEVSVDLTSRPVDLVSEGIDVAIRMGPMPDSQLVKKRLGTIQRYLCAAPKYLERRGVPHLVEDLREHDLLEMPAGDGRPRPWILTNRAGDSVRTDARPKLCINCPATIHRLVLNGAGVGGVSGYLCKPDIKAGRLVRILPDWSLPAIEVNLVFPSSREMAPAVRAFVDFMRSASSPGKSWQDDLLPA